MLLLLLYPSNGECQHPIGGLLTIQFERTPEQIPYPELQSAFVLWRGAWCGAGWDGRAGNRRRGGRWTWRGSWCGRNVIFYRRCSRGHLENDLARDSRL